MNRILSAVLLEGTWTRTWTCVKNILSISAMNFEIVRRRLSAEFVNKARQKFAFAVNGARNGQIWRESNREYIFLHEYSVMFRLICISCKGDIKFLKFILSEFSQQQWGRKKVLSSTHACFPCASLWNGDDARAISRIEPIMVMQHKPPVFSQRYFRVFAYKSE